MVPVTKFRSLVGRYGGVALQVGVLFEQLVDLAVRDALLAIGDGDEGMVDRVERVLAEVEAKLDAA